MTPLLVLVACECSGKVRNAFRKLGHNAWSCDLLPADDDSFFHFQGDCIQVIETGWDLIIMHPPCTALAVSGNAWYGTGMPKNDQRHEAIKWTMDLFNLAKEHAPRVAMENPVGVLPIKPSQYVQPWMFGHPESKKTGLWLHNLKPLEATDTLQIPERGYWDNQTPSGQNKLAPSSDRAKLRSETYAGIASAMADQWGTPPTEDKK